jgi:hypothetical protein
MHYDVGMIWSATTSSIAAYFASSPTFGLYPTLEGNNKEGPATQDYQTSKGKQHGILETT